MTIRAVIYARVSSTAQRERDTIEAQLRELPAFVERMGWELVGTYVDDGKSAATGKLGARGGFADLARDAEARLFDIVVIRAVDRLTRTDDIRERAAVFGPFQRAGVRIVSPSGGDIDLRTMMGQLDATLRALYAAEESRLRTERVIAGQLLAVTLGRKGRGRTPYGLVFERGHDARGVWKLDPVRAPIVREIFERVAAGESCQAIADDLERRGVPRAGVKAWTKHRVWEVLQYTHPTGEWKVRGGSVTVTVPAIVDLELATRARAALKAKRMSGLDRTWHVYLLAKLARCGKCGQAIRVRSAVHTRKHAWQGQSHYNCVGRCSPLPPGTVRCDAPYTPTASADARAWEAICRELQDPELGAALVALRSERAGDTRTWDDDAAGYRKQLDRLDGVETALLARFRRGAIGEKAMDAELASLSRERAMLREQAAFADRARESTVRATRRLEDAEGMLVTLREKLATATPTQRRDVIAMMVDPGGVVFHGSRVHIELWVERPVVDGAIVGAGFCSGDRVSSFRIRLVA